MTTGATPQHLDWPAELDSQLSWHWQNQLRPRLEGLSDTESYDYPASADQALVALDAQYQRWIDSVRQLDLDALAGRCREPGFETASMAALILHIHREVIHHGAEIALLRDLHRTGLANRAIG